MIISNINVEQIRKIQFIPDDFPNKIQEFNVEMFYDLDINGDYEIDLLDIYAIVIDILYNENYNSNSDFNFDGIVNLIDILMLVNWIVNSD